MPILQIALFGIVVVVFSAVIKQTRPEFYTYLILAASLVLFLVVLSNISGIFGIYTEMEEWLGEYKEYLGILAKVIGITYICDFSAGICKDAGQQTLAGQIEMCAKISVFLTGMPILMMLFDCIRGYFA